MGSFSHFLTNFAHFGFKIDFLTKFLDDSAWFRVEKLKKHGFETKKLKILSLIRKYPKTLNDHAPGGPHIDGASVRVRGEDFRSPVPICADLHRNGLLYRIPGQPESRIY